MSDPVLTSQQAASYCGMALQTFYNRLSTGTGPKKHKRGARNAFYQSDLDAWNAADLEEEVA